MTRAADVAEVTYRVIAVDRAIDLLQAFTPRTPDLGLSQIAALVGLHRATALRLLSVLMQRGLVERDVHTGRYRLGLQLIVLAETAKSQNGLVARALPAMRRVHERLNETTFLSVRAGDGRVNVEQIVGLQELRRVTSIGETKPLYVGASSKVLLAAMPDDWIDDYMNRTPLVAHTAWTVVDRAALLKEIERVRARGYAQAMREGDAQTFGAAAPLRDALGNVIAALAISVPLARYTPELMKRVVEEVVAEAAGASGSAKQARA